MFQVFFKMLNRGEKIFKSRFKKIFVSGKRGGIIGRIFSGKGKNRFFSFLLLVFLFVMVRNAWMGDDAYITMRTVDNFVNGYGLRWNLMERVQSYTHPLWMFLISVFYFFTREAYFTVVFLSLFVSLFVMWIFLFKTSVKSDFSGGGESSSRFVFVRRLNNFSASLLLKNNSFLKGKTSTNNWSIFLGFVVLLSSKAFIDYTTSGLENPLTYLLIALFSLMFFKETQNLKRFFWLCFIACMAMLNRFDTILLFLPPLLYVFIKLKDKKTAVLYGFLAFLPFVFWEIFSLVYYGFPFPNTYYAKMAGDWIPLKEYLIRGWIYILDSLRYDPITLVSIVLIFIMCIYKKHFKALALVSGAVLYIAYVVKVGGDFMSGRFFSAPLLLAMFVFVYYFVLGRVKVLIIVFFIIVYSILSPYSPIFASYDYTYDRALIWENIRSRDGVMDERGCYYQDNGFFRLFYGYEVPNSALIKNGHFYKELSFSVHVFKYTLFGMHAYHASRRLHFLDYIGLTDAFIARMPLESEEEVKGFRVGHIIRHFPPGYVDTLAYGVNVIEDENLAEFYDKLSIIIKGDLWSKERLGEIWRMNIGRYDYLLE